MIDTLLERDVLPDRLVRIGIRRLLAQRLREEDARYVRDSYVADLKTRPLAEHTAAANAQHYEVPTRFFQLCLGPRLKYSSGLYPTGRETLATGSRMNRKTGIDPARSPAFVTIASTTISSPTLTVGSVRAKVV